MVTVLKSLAELVSYRSGDKGKIGFVPTMGNLHAGHLSLMERGLQEFDTVYFSIFVNPKQFGPQEDFTKYPRTLEEDLIKIESCAGKFADKKVIVFAPENPAEVFADTIERNVSIEGIKDILEGEIRPGHFDGVATVVYRLFELVKPQSAYFGQKDYQQLLVIKQMVRDLKIPVEVVGMPIVRETSGLALSSRNQYLSPEEKIQGLELSKSLREISSIINFRKENLPRALEATKKMRLDQRWNYLEIRDAENLSSNLSGSKKVVLLGVYQLRSTRLLDNLEVTLA